MRYAIYFTPQEGCALARFGGSVLAGESEAWAGIAPDGVVGLVADPRRYGFHATLKAPFRLAPGREARGLAAALEAFAAGTPPVAIGPLVPRLLGRFVALVPAEPSTALQLLAAECVAAFEPFRAPMTPQERARRLASPLSPRHLALLNRWGYPYVFEAFRFHMTLTGPLPDDLRDPVAAGISRDFTAAAVGPVTIDALSLLVEETPGARFRLVARVPLAGSPA
jgi:putative phosphonate metabolism protein